MKVSAFIHGALCFGGLAKAALQQVTDITLPSNLKMYISVPAKIATRPAIIVGVGPLFSLYYLSSAHITSSFMVVMAQLHNGTTDQSCQNTLKLKALYSSTPRQANTPIAGTSRIHARSRTSAEAMPLGSSV